MADDSEAKFRDPFIFKKADDFFKNLDDATARASRPSTVHYQVEDQQVEGGKLNSACSHGRVFRFNDNSLLLVQFIRPKVWRIRFDAGNKEGRDFTDFNTRTLLRETTSELIKILDDCEQINWKVELHIDPRFFILQSVRIPSRHVVVQLWIQRNPFKIIAMHSVKSLPPAEKLPSLQNAADIRLHRKTMLTEADGAQPAIIWQTKIHPLQYDDNATVLSIEKAVTADYMGFGEQGGKHLFKKKTFMNFFNFDNMRYQNVYEKGPYDDREPLYHSEPYWLEVDALPGYKSQIATFVDNYSHVCVDLGVTDSTTLRVATRFNTFQYIVAAGDSVREVIQLYTSIIGRPRLKPRYILGYHQGCYGYDNKDMVQKVIEAYRHYQFPIDGMHIDVDMQDDYRTFTINTSPGHFPQPEEMFRSLRDAGVKCSTNITPYINSAPNTNYSTLNEGLEHNYFVKDRRDCDPSAPHFWMQRYLQYGYKHPPNPYLVDPNTQKPNYWVEDTYRFGDVFDHPDQPFHGGVYYGWRNGHPGYYPNLNDSEVREWWGKQYKSLFKAGLEFIWQDMTSPCIAEEYGDMKSFPFRLLLDSDLWSGDPKEKDIHGNPHRRKAIEIWSLYSYNLLKATYHGLNNIWKGANGEVDRELEWRKNRRNFIIGRGSFAGSHRYAGLWTGDNASTWEFLDISVAQVLALGLSGVTISGADVGGFEFIDSEHDYANPELIIRWYCAYFLLPWFRNHYTRICYWPNGKIKKEGKLFQEPYAYHEHYEKNKWKYSDAQGMLYLAVLPTTRYFTQLRYSLLQLMYDAMFENLLSGLPIARAMPITDEYDRSLFSEDNQRFTRSQYLVGNDLLVAPKLRPGGNQEERILYLPYPNDWFHMNLRPDLRLGATLEPKVHGGTRVSYRCPISEHIEQIPYTAPMFIREGAIIPKIQVRDYVPDPTDKIRDFSTNPITIHVYPGKDSKYNMYLDDGISRDSAPSTEYHSSLLDEGSCSEDHWARVPDAQSDELAASKFAHITIEQRSTKTADINERIRVTRSVTMRALWNGYGDLSGIIGDVYTLVLWHDTDVALNSIKVIPEHYWQRHDGDAERATVAKVPVREVHERPGIELNVIHDQ